MLVNINNCKNAVGFSKRKQNYHVQFEMMGHEVDVWLPYELIEPMGESREAGE